MASYIGNSPDLILKARQTSYRYVATSGQSIFSGADSNGFTMVNDLKNTKVFLNGVLLDVTDYTLYVDQVHLIEIATTGDIIEVITAPSFYTSDMYNKSEVDQKITNVIGTAGSALDTLGELSDALNDDANFAATVTTALGTKANQSTTYTKTEVDTAINPTNVSDKLNASTGYFDLPTGTTAQRPASPVNGMTRYNTTLNQFEVYQNSQWVQYVASNTYFADYLVVAGGGAGATGYGNGNGSGGGGAGGFITTNTNLVPGTSYTVTVGAGGAAVNANRGTNQGGARGNSGSNSSLGSLAIAIGGGGGGLFDPGFNGGSGGGGNTPGSGTSGQGFSGGQNSLQNSPYRGGGGGGASSAGDSGASSGNGGSGITWLNGSTYAGGGGGGVYASTGSVGSGGSGIGGGGGNNTGSGGAGAANTGSGGGGGGSPGGGTDGALGGNGASGVIIIRYLGSQRGSGGSITYSGGYTYHTFTSSGTYTA